MTSAGTISAQLPTHAGPTGGHDLAVSAYAAFALVRRFLGAWVLGTL